MSDILKLGTQVYIDESPLANEEKLVSYHIIDIDEDSEIGLNSKAVLVFRDYVDTDLEWTNGSSQFYKGNVIDTYLNSSDENGFLHRFKDKVKGYFVGGKINCLNSFNFTYEELTRKVFIPSEYELFGDSENNNNAEKYESIWDWHDYDKGCEESYWTRTPNNKDTTYMVNEIGIKSNRNPTKKCGVRPAIWIDSRYFTDDEVEDKGVSFDLMYSIEIVDSKSIEDTTLDTSKYDTQYINNSIKYPVEYAVSRFTPSQLRGFARVQKNLKYDGRIITPDLDMCSNDMFYSYYIDNREALIYGVSVDSDRIICKYVYRFLDSDLAINVGSSNISSYTPEQLVKFYNSGMRLQYLNDDLQLLKYNEGTQTRSGNNSSVEFLSFSNQDNTIYKLVVSQNGTTTRTTYKKLVSSYELCKQSANKFECNYDTAFLFDICGDNYTQITYNGNILYTDKLHTNENKYVGFYFDEFDTAIYKIEVSASNNLNTITRTLHTRIIKRVYVNGAGSGFNTYTIEGLVDRSDYFIENVTTLNITYPQVYADVHFDMWITVKAGSSACNVVFPEGTVFVKNQEFGTIGSRTTSNTISAGKTREISIKDGVVVSMPKGEEWMEFDD